MKPTKSMDQAADIYTKRFTDPHKWMQLCYLNNLVHTPTFFAKDTKNLDDYFAKYVKQANIPPARGGKSNADWWDKSGNILPEEDEHLWDPPCDLVDIPAD